MHFARFVYLASDKLSFIYTSYRFLQLSKHAYTPMVIQTNNTYVIMVKKRGGVFITKRKSYQINVDRSYHSVAPDRHIFVVVVTEIFSPPIMPTVIERLFCPSTLQIAQPNSSSAQAEVPLLEANRGSTGKYSVIVSFIDLSKCSASRLN